MGNEQLPPADAGPFERRVGHRRTRMLWGRRGEKRLRPYAPHIEKMIDLPYTRLAWFPLTPRERLSIKRLRTKFARERWFSARKVLRRPERMPNAKLTGP